MSQDLLLRSSFRYDSLIVPAEALKRYPNLAAYAVTTARITTG